MRLRLFVLSFALVNLSYNGVQYAMTAQSEQRPITLSGEDMMRILPGNTLLAYDESGPFWMYYPDLETIWGQSSSGDVDVGRWWAENGRYCRAWRRWYDGATQCWVLASYGDDRIVWMDGRESIQGESQVQPGNTIGAVQPLLLATLTTGTDIEPVAVTGAIGPQRRARFADRDPARGGAQSGSSSGGGDGSGSGSSSDGSSGGGNGGSGGGDVSGSGDGGSGGNGDKGGKSDHGDKGGHGGGKGGGKD